MLKEFLDSKPLYYDEIDYSRMPRVYERVKSHFPHPKIIHLIGTNGKGTTGRFLATALYSLGFRVGHYTSPHIIDFNERIWCDGKNVSDETLHIAHKKLQNILSTEESNSLSYFEYTTLLAMLIFTECDYVVLEAGLGGENDATAVFDKELTLVTPIDIDHEAFLGRTIKEIATTKLNAIQTDAILGQQKFNEVYIVANTIADIKGAKIDSYNEFLEDEDMTKIRKISRMLGLAPYLQQNLKLAISALKFLDIEYRESSFKNSKLFGRLTKISENILLDVGHNRLAATSIADALKGEKYILVYNSYRDKNYEEILNILKPIVWHVEIIDILNERVVPRDSLQNILNSLEIKYKEFTEIKKDFNYLVFGSFSVIESFLKAYHE
ncbi:MAG: bifunctional folylpolyglutamate synthase/dihydrofolate synthase [Campylobacterota bacterium]|nr:bifunctional folylpolyglutamate synthase/dihydrofolate synthase [Campylobacterota bacterium]